MMLEILLPISAIIAISLLIRWWYDPLRAIPGPSGLPFLGNTFEVTSTSDVYALTRKWQRKYGDIFKYYVLLGGYRIQLSDPDSIKYVLVKNASNYIRPVKMLTTLLPSLGNGLLTTNGQEHAQMRKLFNPKFSYGNVKLFAPVFNAKTDELIQYWKNKLCNSSEETIKENILEKTCSLTLDVIGLCGFGYKFNSLSEGGSKISNAFNKLMTGEVNLVRKGLEDIFPLLKLIPSQDRQEAKEANELCQSVISEYWKNKLCNSSEETIKENILEKTCSLTLDVIGLCGFGYKFNSLSEGGSKISNAFNKLMTGEVNLVRKGLEDIFPLLKLIPSQDRQEAKEANELCQSVISEVVKERQIALASAPDSKECSDLLQTVMNACAESGKSLSNQDLCAQIFTFMTAGHETTSLTMSWTLTLLAMHSDIQERVREEIKAALGDSNEVKWEDLDKLHYLENCINEAMRLYPSALQFAKIACKDDNVGGYVIPGGTKVMIGLGTMNRNEKIWNNPDTYDPDRFDEKRESSDHSLRDCFLPFGRGPRICIGAKFAQVELKIVLAKLLRTFRFKFESNTPAGSLGSLQALTLRPHPPPILEIGLASGRR